MLTVVAGPPCAGKSTHIARRATPGDVIVDLDRLALALSVEGTANHSYPAHVRHVAIGARRAAIDRAAGVARLCNVWIIHTAPTAAEINRYASVGGQVIVIDPGIKVCVERAQQLRPEVIPVIQAWYAGTLRPGKFKAGQPEDEWEMDD